jgi:hypothetical protein
MSTNEYFVNHDRMIKPSGIPNSPAFIARMSSTLNVPISSSGAMRSGMAR